MNQSELLAASCRAALAALLHQLGTFAERAGLDVNPDDFATHLQRQAKRQETGGEQLHAHQHAEWTALAIDRLVPWLPPLIGDLAPLIAWKYPDVDDSLINAAANDHTPRTFLQSVITTADLLASGLARETLDRLETAEDRAFDEADVQREDAKFDHVTARQLTLFEQIRLTGPAAPVAPATRYPLKPMAPKFLFPAPAQHVESADQAQAQREYRELWDGFAAGLAEIPTSHRQRLDLWLDHFETLWQTFTHAVPTTTACGAIPAVSLFDHSKAVAALAVGIWRYHHDRSDDPTAVALEQLERADWAEQKLLLVQGDLFGIQEFIFASGGETQRRAAKLLRGRSFYVGLVTECAALRVLDALSLPPTSQIINAAGKFLIVAANTPETIQRLIAVRTELDAWFLEHSYGQSGVGLAWLPAACNDFLSASESANTPGRFRDLMHRLFRQLDVAKAQRFGLCGPQAPAPLFADFLDAFDNKRGVCEVDGRSPAVTEISDSARTIQLGRLAKDQINLGNWLTRHERLLVSREPILSKATLGVDVFGYRIGFTSTAEETGTFGPEVNACNLLRAWDLSLPVGDGSTPLWNGYGRRAINAWIPRFNDDEVATPWLLEKYRGHADNAEMDSAPGEPKTFGHLACEDRTLNNYQRWVGIRGLMTLKGDVDNLGLIFQQGLRAPTIAKMAALSRQMNAFFSIWLPWHCSTRVPNTYTVFAGGDDFFLVGPWRSQIELARTLRSEFQRYVAGNPDIHFSAGLSLTKPGLPVRHLAELAEEALVAAKNSRPAKESVTCFGETVPWEIFDALDQAGAELSRVISELGLSTGYLYGLLELIEKAERVHQRPENAIWHSQFAYRTQRMLETKPGLQGRDKVPERRRWMQQLAKVIAQDGIAQFKRAYRIPLFTHLYQIRA